MGHSTMEIINISVPGQPIPKARPRITKFGRAYTPKRTKDYEALIQKHLPDTFIDTPVEVYITAIFKRPLRLKRKQDPTALIPHDKRPDLDNIVKAVLDALNYILKDDSIVVSIHAQKFYAELHNSPRTIISIKEYTT